MRYVVSEATTPTNVVCALANGRRFRPSTSATLRSTASLALLGLALLSGCAGVLSAAPSPVTAARLEPGGKGLFVVRSW